MLPCVQPSYSKEMCGTIPSSPCKYCSLWCRATLWALAEMLRDLGKEWQWWMKAVLLFWSRWHGVPNYGDAACLTSEAKHPMGGGGGRTGSRSWVGEATAVHRCSCVLSRCSTSPPSNWQMALDVRWFNGPRVFFSCLSQPLAGTSVMSWPGTPLRAEAESDTF